MLKTKRRKTVDDYMALPVEHGVELVEGEFIMSPSGGTRHQRVTGNLYVHLRSHVLRCGLGEVFIAPLDVVLSQEDVVQPDVLFVAAAHSSRVTDRVRGVPDLVVEVLSPSNASHDRFVKRDLYARHGVPEFWIVDPETRTVDVLTLEGGAYQLHAVFESNDVLNTPTFADLNLALNTTWA